MDSAGALAELKNFQGSRKGAGDYYDQYQKDLGVGDVKTRADDMRGLIRNTETALKGVGQAVAGRTRGQLVTEAQRSRLANLEREPLAGQLSEFQGNYGEEMQNYRDLLGQASQKSQFAYQSDADKLASLEGNYSKLFATEQAAEAKRQWEAQQAEQRRQFEAQLAESRRASRAAAAAASFSPSVGALNRTSTTDLSDPIVKAANANKDWAYQSVQNFLKQGTKAAQSDYAATLKSANNGNVRDKLKIELYKQYGISAPQATTSGGGFWNTVTNAAKRFA